MIKQVWRLVLDNQTLGVRVQTKHNLYYDITINVYKDQLKLNPNNLQPLELIEYDDLLMTEEEFYSGQLIEDASNNKEILRGVKEFVTRRAPINANPNYNDPKYLARRAKKVSEYSQSYYTYLPNKWLKEFAEYHFDNFEGNKDIYTRLTQPQREIIKEYFRWRSRMIFNEQRGASVLRKSVKKAEKLVNLMDESDDWQYDGTVDTGHASGGYCELGHALRYEHYAFSPSLNRQIIFGSTCVADFFDLDSSVIRNITKAQETLLKEIKSIVFIIDTGKYDEYRTQYNQLWDILKHFKGQFNTKVKNGSGWSRYMGGFDKLKLPLTRSMVLTYKELAKLYKTAQEQDELTSRIDQTLQDLQSSKYNQEVINNVLQNKYTLTLARYLRVYLLLGQYHIPFVTKGLEIVDDLSKVQEKLKPYLLSSQRFKQKARQEYSFVYGKTGRRLVTVKEKEYNQDGLVREPFLGKNKTIQLMLLMKHATQFVPIKTSSVPVSVPQHQLDYVDEFLKNEKYIRRALKWGMQPGFEAELQPLNNTIDYLETAEDEQIDTDSIKYQYDFINQHKETLTENESRRFNRIPRYALEGSKEEDFIRNVYNRTLKRLNLPADAQSEPQSQSNQPNQQENKVVQVDETLDQKLDRILEAGASGVIPKSLFAFTIIPTIQRTGRISDKQKRFIDEALKKIEDSKPKEE